MLSTWRTFEPYLLSILRIVAAFLFIQFGIAKLFGFPGAEVALIHATLILVLVINSQTEVFSLGLHAETKACRDEVTMGWKDRPLGPSASVESWG